MTQDPDDLPLSARLGAKAERETIEAIIPVLVQNRAETFKALLREDSRPLVVALAQTLRQMWRFRESHVPQAAPDGG